MRRREQEAWRSIRARALARSNERCERCSARSDEQFLNCVIVHVQGRPEELHLNDVEIVCDLCVSKNLIFRNEWDETIRSKHFIQEKSRQLRASTLQVCGFIYASNELLNARLKTTSLRSYRGMFRLLLSFLVLTITIVSVVTQCSS